MMPARRAVSSGSPFFVVPPRTCSSPAADILIRPRAIASRAVAAFCDTSTIRIFPRASTWESRGAGSVVRLRILVTLDEKERQALERHRQIHALQLHAARHLVCTW